MPLVPLYLTNTVRVSDRRLKSVKVSRACAIPDGRTDGRTVGRSEGIFGREGGSFDALTLTALILAKWRETRHASRAPCDEMRCEQGSKKTASAAVCIRSELEKELGGAHEGTYRRFPCYDMTCD